MKQPRSHWQTEDLSRTYLEGIRGAIPLAEAQIDVMLKIVEQWRPNPGHVLDLGCGDGTLGRALLARFDLDHATFVDFSEPMLASAKSKLKAYPQALVARADFSTPDWQHVLVEDRFDVIVSGFSIHHQPDDRKQTLYKELFDRLAPGGVFLNIEHVASPTDAVQALFDDYFVDHLFAFRQQLDPAETREDVRQRYYDRPDKVENILAPVEMQCQWLREIGFIDVDCFFKVFELALFGGRRP